MDMVMKRLPIGMDGFEKIRSNDFYYVDKTMFIAELLHNWGEVNLFTRPRRFGKTLNMSMLKAFFEIGCDKTLFDGLKISQEKELCNAYMGRFPVISVSLKSVDGASFETACHALRSVIGVEAERFTFLLDSDKLTEGEKEKYRGLMNVKNGLYTTPYEALLTSVQTLSLLLSKHYGTKTIILIDEYDVPLDKAFQSGFYDEMVQLIRNLLGNALKTNSSLQFAVLTGCLRISKESIFTGLNNLRVNTVTDAIYDEYFGFTDADVKELLESYNLSEHYDRVNAWYDGYRFGNVAVYCPWDVINYCYDARVNTCTEPKNYWANTSGNGMVRRFINLATQQTRDEIEQLIAGKAVVKEINQELTYNELDSSIHNLWSVLLTTGYLTVEEALSVKMYRLAIPNMEIRDLFNSQVKEWFQEKAAAQPKKLEAFCNAVLMGEAETVQKLLTDYLKQTISIRDTNVRTARKENFYHGILLGLLSYPESWIVKSNQESGDGYSDILIKDLATDTGIVIEVKYAERGKLDSACAEVLLQMKSRDYAEALYDDGMDRIVKYGMAFYKKRCKVVCLEE